MERVEAIRELKKLINKDLVSLASQYQVTVWKGNRKNKGWAGHVLVHRGKKGCPYK